MKIIKRKLNLPVEPRDVFQLADVYSVQHTYSRLIVKNLAQRIYWGDATRCGSYWSDRASGCKDLADSFPNIWNAIRGEVVAIQRQQESQNQRRAVKTRR
jgi:hypothetical protein